MSFSNRLETASEECGEFFCSRSFLGEEDDVVELGSKIGSWAASGNVMNSAFLVKIVTSQEPFHPLIVRIILRLDRILDNQLVPFQNATIDVDWVLSWVHPLITVLGSARLLSMGKLGERGLNRD